MTLIGKITSKSIISVDVFIIFKMKSISPASSAVRLHHLGSSSQVMTCDIIIGWDACKHLSGSSQLLFKQLTWLRPDLKRVPTPRTQRIRPFMKYGAGGLRSKSLAVNLR